MNATDMPKLKPIETVSDTMKHLMTTHMNQTQESGGAIERGAFQLPKTIMMQQERQPVDTCTSQTVSSGFFDQVGQAAISRPNMMMTKGSKQMKDTSGISFVPPSAKRGSEMMASKKLNSQLNRNINTESEFGELIPKLLKVEPDDKNLGTLPLGSL